MAKMSTWGHFWSTRPLVYRLSASASLCSPSQRGTLWPRERLAGLNRQLGVLDAYVARMPRNARALVLASLAPRFFPQHLDAEDEMLLDHAFPPADQLLAAIDPDTYEAMDDED